MHVTVICPDCEAALPMDASEAPTAVTCGGCGRAIPLAISDPVKTDAGLDRCPLCEGTDFYIRKDFDPKLGLTVVTIGALISVGFYWYGMDLVAYGILGGAALIDLFVYGRLGDLSICYRCHTEFRGSYPRTAGIFDLATADELELEWDRKKSDRFPRKVSVPGT